MNAESLLRELPFYDVDDFQLDRDLCCNSQRVRDEAYWNNNFYNCITNITKSEIFKQLDFDYYTVDGFNNKVNSFSHNIELSIFHLNIRSLNKNEAHLTSFLQLLNVKFDVIVLSEIWNYNLEFYHSLFQDYTFYYDTPSVSKVGGVGIFVHNSWNCDTVDDYKFENYHGVEVENLWLEISKSAGKRTHKYIVGGVYRHPNSNVSLFNELLEKSLCKIKKTCIPSIIAGDINIDLSKYREHSSTTDYVDTLISNNFLPVIVMPTRITESSASVIDHMYYFEGKNVKRELTVNTGNLWSDITDHLPNYFVISYKKPSKSLLSDRPSVRIYSNKNIHKFRRLVQSIDWKIMYSCNNVNDCYTFLDTNLQKCFNESFNTVKLSRSRAKDKKWFTSNLKNCSKKKMCLYQKWLKTGSVEDEIEYKTYRTCYKKMLNEAEKNYYSSQFDLKSNSVKQIWRNLNAVASFTKQKSQVHIRKLTKNGIDITSPKQICNTLNEYFCNIGPTLAKNIHCSTNDFMQYCFTTVKESMYCNPVSAEEIINVVSRFQDNKSPGFDNIGSKLLKNVLYDILQPLVYIYNLSFTTGLVPSKLKIAKVIPAYKKGEKNNPGNYRPISLLSIFDKLLEKLMYNRIIAFLDKHNILYKFQYGFRRCHSTSLALIEMLDNVYTNLDTGNVTVAVYLDLQKAFDTVDHSILLYKLQMYGIRGIVLDWFQDYLTDRQQVVTIANNVSDLGSITCGVPQGSVLGPLLFLLYVNDIQNCAPDCSIKLFADDTNIFVTGKSVKEAVDKANNSLLLLSNWFAVNKLSLSIDKTSYSIFGKNVNKNHNHILRLCNMDIKEVTCCKYLGIYVDNHLVWKNHIDYVYTKILKFVSIFYKLRENLNSRILQMIYFSFIYPQILYGIEIYANTNKSAIKRLMVLNNKVLRILQHQRIRVHNVELYRNYNTLPIPELHNYQLLILVHKFLYYNEKLPPAFNNYFTLNYNVHNYNTRKSNELHLQSLQTTVGKKIIKFKASQLWNQLPNEIKEIKSQNLFKSKLKNYLYSILQTR